MTLRAIISGGGIGGLATATALAQRGWNVTVYEAQGQLRANGSGIYTWSNGMAVLKELGAYERAMRDAFFGMGVEQRDHRQRVIAQAALPPGTSVVSIHRRDLLAGLEDAARRSGVQIETGRMVVDASADGCFTFANGDRVEADLAVGCDGVWSQVRKGIGVEIYHQPIQEGALRTVVRATQEDMPIDARNRCIENWNGKRRFLVTPINANEIYLALCCPADDEEARDPSVRPVWRETFPEWAFLLDRLDAEITWNTYSLMKCKSWSAGRTCLVGDSAFAQPPNLGQGGGMAMQGGLALASYLADVSDRRDIPDALRSWEMALRPLVDHCQYWSVMFGELANVPDEHRTVIIQGIAGNQWLREALSRVACSAPLVKSASQATIA